MKETPKTDALSLFLATQFPATRGNLELGQKLLEIGEMELQLDEAKVLIESMRKIVQDCCHQQLPKLQRERDKIQGQFNQLRWLSARIFSKKNLLNIQSDEDRELVDKWQQSFAPMIKVG